MTNNNCDGSGPHSANQEVRVLPTGPQSNAILCRACYNEEIKFRKERNRSLGDHAKFDLPTWEELKPYP